MSLDEDTDSPRERGPSKLETARRKLRTAGLFLLLNGLFGFVLEIATLGIALTQPTVIHDQLVKMVEAQPDGPNKQKQLDDLKKDEASMRLDSPTNLVMTGLTGVMCFVVIIGAVMMRGGSGYGLSMAAAILAIIPITGCCCTGLPIGIWSLVVLLNPDVKRVFQSKKTDEYDRDSE
jgi:hypothetical protein